MGNITALRRRRSGSFSGVRSRNVTSAGGTVVVAVIRHGDGAHVTGVGTSRLSPFETESRRRSPFRGLSNDVFGRPTHARAREYVALHMRRAPVARASTDARGARARARRLASCAVNAAVLHGKLPVVALKQQRATLACFRLALRNLRGGADVGKRVGRARRRSSSRSRAATATCARRALAVQRVRRGRARAPRRDFAPGREPRPMLPPSVAAGFSRYRELAPPQRANLVAEAQYLLNAANTREAQVAPNREMTCERERRRVRKTAHVSPARHHRHGACRRRADPRPRRDFRADSRRRALGAALAREGQVDRRQERHTRLRELGERAEAGLQATRRDAPGERREKTNGRRRVERRSTRTDRGIPVS